MYRTRLSHPRAGFGARYRPPAPSPFVVVRALHRIVRVRRPRRRPAPAGHRRDRGSGDASALEPADGDVAQRAHHLFPLRAAADARPDAFRDALVRDDGPLHDRGRDAVGAPRGERAEGVEVHAAVQQRRGDVAEEADAVGRPEGRGSIIQSERRGGVEGCVDQLELKGVEVCRD